jgi:hypothetical protein
MLDIRWARRGERGSESGYHPGYLIIGPLMNNSLGMPFIRDIE